MDFAQKSDFFSYLSMKTVSFQPLKKHYFFEKLDRRSWESSSKKVGLHNTMQFHLFFRTVKTIGLHLISIKRYSKNAHPSYFLKWIIVLGLDYLYNKSWREGLRVLAEQTLLYQISYNSKKFCKANMEKMFKY